MQIEWYLGENTVVFGGKYSCIWGKYSGIWGIDSLFEANIVVFGANTSVFGGKYSCIWGQRQCYFGKLV